MLCPVSMGEYTVWMTDAVQPSGTPSGPQNEIWCDAKILRYRLVAPIDEAEANRLDTLGRGFLDRKEACAVLIDMQRSSDFSSAARKRWVSFLQHPEIKRTAIFGGSVFVRTLAAFVIGASQRQNIRSFATEAEALDWLQKEAGKEQGQPAPVA